MRERLYLATIDAQAPALAEKYDLGLEIDEFCTAMNMDGEDFAVYDAKVQPLLHRAKIFHAPFNELFPAAIDPQARALARQRFDQAWDLARHYGMNRMVVHGGYLPLVYFPQWFVPQSVLFWKDFLSSKPEDCQILLENVLESEPELLRDVVAEVDDPRFRLCLDVGHGHVRQVSSVAPERWLEVCAPYLAHVHLHNNDGVWDWHSPLGEGEIPIQTLLEMLRQLAPEASITLEHVERSEDSLCWLTERGWI